MNLKEHLRNRYFDYSRYSGIYIDEVNTSVVLPLWNLSGQMVGYQQYSPLNPKTHIDNPREAKYFTWVTKPAASKNAELAVWGLETLDYTRPLYLTEGVFDACRLHWNGFPAIAALSNNPEHLRSWFSLLPMRIISCVQGDTAGKELAKYGDEAIYLPAGKDVGDLTEEEFELNFAKYDDRK